MKRVFVKFSILNVKTMNKTHTHTQSQKINDSYVNKKNGEGKEKTNMKISHW